MDSLREHENTLSAVLRVCLSMWSSAPVSGAAHQLERALAGRCCDRAVVVGRSS